MVAVLGAPDDQPDHATRGVRCALDLDGFAQRFSVDKVAQGIAFGATRMGVHTGPAVVGNIGGEKHFDYTAIGDTVNTAARLEGANKFLGTRVCISGATAERCPDMAISDLEDRFCMVAGVDLVRQSDKRAWDVLSEKLSDLRLFSPEEWTNYSATVSLSHIKSTACA